jgi:hypothetical protein
MAEDTTEAMAKNPPCEPKTATELPSGWVAYDPDGWRTKSGEKE